MGKINLFGKNKKKEEEPAAPPEEPQVVEDELELPEMPPPLEPEQEPEQDEPKELMLDPTSPLGLMALYSQENLKVLLEMNKTLDALGEKIDTNTKWLAALHKAATGKE